MQIRENFDDAWISSDHHFWHKNILTFQKDAGSRDFAKGDVKRMNAGIIERHNDNVGVNDKVILAGDFGFCNVRQTIEILEQMHGIKYFVYGNHDKQMYVHDVKKYFEVMCDYLEIKVGNTKVNIFHYPIFSWNREHHGAVHLYGHTHNGIPFIDEGFSKDIGCDANECVPFKIQDVIDDLATHRKENGLKPFRNARERDGEPR